MTLDARLGFRSAKSGRCVCYGAALLREFRSRTEAEIFRNRVFRRVFRTSRLSVLSQCVVPFIYAFHPGAAGSWLSVQLTHTAPGLTLRHTTGYGHPHIWRRIQTTSVASSTYSQLGIQMQGSTQLRHNGTASENAVAHSCRGAA